MSLQSEILADSPTRYFQHNEPSGTACIDSSINALNGTYTGGFTLAQPGIPSGGTAVLFNGTTGYVEFTANGVDTSSGDWTYEAWIFPTSYGDCGIVGAQSVGGFALTLHSTPNIHVTIVDSSDATAGTVTPPLSSWSHVGATFVDSSNLVTNYLNGQPNGSSTFGSAPTAGKKASAIGARSHDVGTAGFFVGSIQHSVIYQGAALSGARMLAHYNAGIATVGGAILPAWPRVRYTG